MEIKLEQFQIKPNTLLIAKMPKDAKEDIFIKAAEQIKERLESAGVKTAKCLVVPYDFQITEMDDDLLEGLGLRRIEEKEVEHFCGVPVKNIKELAEGTNRKFLNNWVFRFFDFFPICPCCGEWATEETSYQLCESCAEYPEELENG